MYILKTTQASFWKQWKLIGSNCQIHVLDSFTENTCMRVCVLNKFGFVI